MRLRTVMLVLALLFVPVLAGAGSPRDPEFSPPAAEGVTIAAVAASLGGWLYMAGNPEKKRRVEAVAGTMGHCFNALPSQRSSAASAAAGVRASVAPNSPPHQLGSAAGASAAVTATPMSTAAIAPVPTPVLHATSAAPAAASHDGSFVASMAPTPSHAAPKCAVGSQWRCKNRMNGTIEDVTTCRLEPPTPGDMADVETGLSIKRPDGSVTDTLGMFLIPIVPAHQSRSPAGLANCTTPSPARPSPVSQPNNTAASAPAAARPSPVATAAAAAGRSATAPKPTKPTYVRKGASVKGSKDHVVPFPSGDLQVVDAGDALSTQRAWLTKNVSKLPEWVQITATGLACAACRAAKHVVGGKNFPLNETTAWINAPCTDADVSAAIRAHTRPSKSGSKGRHADSVAATSNNADIAEGFEKEKGMERSAMIKRLKIILYVVVKHEAFERYSDNCTHASDLGAFHDCPVGTDPGSLTSKSASYTSNQSHRELLECLADAVREHWICLRKGSPRWSTLCDETSDVSGKSQNAIAVKIVLPSGKTAVPFAGLHEMPRSTANHLLNALVHQLKERDGFTEEELQLALNDFSADTCSTMFGRLSGLATRLMEKFVNLVARKCGNHKGALAASHGCTAIPYLKNVCLPTLEMMGKQMAASNKKGTFLDEANVEMGTNTSKIGLSSATRWNSRPCQTAKIVSPPNFVTNLLTFIRAGEGGASETYYEDAGRADATSAGHANKVQTREHFAFTQALGDLLPPLVKAGEKLQQWDLDHESYQLAVQSVVDHLQGCLANPATFCPNLHNWKKRADKVDTIGPKLKQTRGRTDGWIDSQMRMLIESLLKEHNEHFEADELTEQLTSTPRRPHRERG